MGEGKYGRGWGEFEVTYRAVATSRIVGYTVNTMNVEFEDDDLDRLEFDPTFDAGHAPGVVRAFRKCMNMIRNAPDERIFRLSKGLHYEKLRGNREGQHSMRLNSQFRLIIRLEGAMDQKVVVVLAIEDYH